MTHSPEVMAMARRCAAKYWQTGEETDEFVAMKILSGEWDDQAYTQAAIVALEECTEMAARELSNSGYNSHRYAAALRTFSHLPPALEKDDG